MAIDPRFNKLWLWDEPRVIDPVIRFNGVVCWLDMGPVLQADPFMWTVWLVETMKP